MRAWGRGLAFEALFPHSAGSGLFLLRLEFGSAVRGFSSPRPALWPALSGTPAPHELPVISSPAAIGSLIHYVRLRRDSAGWRRRYKSTVCASPAKGFCGQSPPDLPRAGLSSATAGGHDPRLRTWSTTPIMSSEDAQVALSALRMPLLQFDQHGPKQKVIGRASHASGFGHRADKHRRLAAL